MDGWQSGVLGWSLGERGSGSPIELDEPLDECQVGVFEFTYQQLLWGRAKDLPEVWLFPQTRPTSLVPFDPQQWLRLEREELKRVSMGGDIRLRFDQSPVRFGNYIIESLKDPESAKDACAFCNEPLHTYFRVGSQQACSACTEKFKQEMQANLARYFRRALIIGAVTAVVVGTIHGLLLASAGLSFGSILIGVLVGMAMRMASRESAGTRYRVAAGALTLVAGSLSWWKSAVTFMSVVYLAIGVLAAWTLAARNVRTEIHGPFQSR